MARELGRLRSVLGIGGAAGRVLSTAWGGSWLFFAAGTVLALAGLVATEATADWFSARLRAQLAPESVRADLLTTVAGAVEPASVSVWLPRD